MDHQTLTLAIRWLHVAAMATAFGGAILVTWLAWRRPIDRVIDIALGYEQLFWLAAGLLVLTGFGNLGAFGPALPVPASDWGRTFIAKLVVVAILVAVSIPRSLAVIELSGRQGGGGALRTAYAGTTGVLAVIVGLAVALAHG
jgi:hypothetical protein